MKTVIVAIWFIITMVVVTLICHMMTLPNTFANITGMTIAVLYSWLSIETECFTSIKLINKKSNENN